MISDEVYQLIAGLDPASAQVVAGMIAAEAAPPTEPLAKAYGEYVAGRVEELRRGIVRQYVSKRAAGQDVESLVQLTTAIAKAQHTFMSGKFEENEHRRDPHTGRFIVMSHRVNYSDKHDVLDNDEESDEGIPHPDSQVGWASRKLTAAQRSKYQQAYLQIAQQVQRYRNLPPGMAQLHVQYKDGTHSEVELDPDRHVPVIPDKTVRRAEIHVEAPERPEYTRRGMTFDAVRALTGNPGFAAHLATTKVNPRPFIESFDGPRQGEEFTSAAAFRRMRTGADLLTAAAGPLMPGPAYLATRTASFVGQYGPQAQQVFGPAVDRAKYRYKGTERKLDPKVTAALKQIRDDWTDPNVAREKMTYGSTESIARPARRPGDEAKPPVEIWHPSPLVDYLKQQLPKQQLAALQRKAGRIPPSQGVIIDRQGRVSAQMVGVGDDWYLPFNLRNLGALQGGEYLRTRTNGGLTTEDIYTGLMAGARSMSVVSHNGLYTMEFDDTLRGSRRYSSTAREMTERYGQLLDAVKNGKVPAGDLDPTVLAEIHEKAAQRFSPARQGKEYQAAVDDMIAEQRAFPTPSQDMHEGWFNEFLVQQAERTHTKSGKPYTVAQLVNEKIIAPSARQVARERDLVDDPQGEIAYNDPKDPEIQEEALRRFEDNPEGAIALMGPGVEKQYRRFVAGKVRAYRDSMKPMELNGPGYDYAMQALQEQYPYFVSRVKFTPWSETEPDAGKDYGYIKPRFNRPAAVQAGYYDDTILGHGKVGADTIRYQNHRVMQRLGRAHENGRGARAASTDTEQSTPAAASSSYTAYTGGGMGSPAAAAPAARPAAAAARPAAPAAAAGNPRRAADLAYVQHVLGQDKFSAGTSLADADGTFGGEAVAPHRAAWMGDEHPDWGRDFNALTVPIGDVQAMSDDELHEHAQKLAKLQADHKLFDLDPGIVARFQRGGQLPMAKPLTRTDLFHASDPAHHDEEYQLGPEFEPGRTASQYKATFDQDDQLQHLADEAGIDDLDDPEFHEMLTDHQLGMHEYMEQWQDWGARHPDGADDDPDDAPPNYPLDELEDDARHAVRLRQLHRRYHEAKAGGTSGGGSSSAGPAAPGPSGPVGGPSLPTGRFQPITIPGLNALVRASYSSS